MFHRRTPQHDGLLSRFTTKYYMQQLGLFKKIEAHKQMAYTFQKMTEIDAQEISKWRYEHPYSFYNPDEASLDQYIAGLLDLCYHYHAIYDGKMLTGFCCFGEDAQITGGDYSLPDTLDIGLGMRPDLVGQGRGKAFLAAILAFAQQEYNATKFRATIATFNQRSQKTFAQAGFEPAQRFLSHYDHTTEFVVMVKTQQQTTLNNSPTPS